MSLSECCRAIRSPTREAHRLRNLAEIARIQGDTAKARALEAEADSIYKEPERDPAMEAALEQAFSGNDPSKMMDAIKQAFRSKKEGA